MKLASLLIPTYQPRSYAGQTPAPYPMATVDKFEKELVGLSPYIVRYPQFHRLHPDTAGRFVHSQVLTRYDIMVEPEQDTLGAAIKLALTAFGGEKICVLFHETDVADIDMAEAEQIFEGLHTWNE
jgi:hypothetical protein